MCSRILLLGSQMEMGGAQRNLLIQAQWLSEHGHEVTAAFSYDKQGIEKQWKSAHPFPIINLKAWRADKSFLANLPRLTVGLARLLCLLLRGRFDAVETFTHHSNLLGIPLAWLAGVPVRIASHRGVIRDFPQWLNWMHTQIINWGFANRLVAVSEYTRQAAIKDGIKPEKITVIPNAVALPKTEPQNREQTRRQLGLTKGSALILTVGRLNPEKGHDLLLQAAAQALQQYPMARFALAGDGVLRKKLELLAQQLEIADAVLFLGHRDDIPDLLAAADIFALPSRSEGMPNALLEAMATGLAAIAFEAGGIGEVLRDEETGLLVPPEDPAAFAQALVRLLDNPSERQRLGSAGRTWVEVHHGIDQMCARYGSLLCPELSANA